MSKVARKEFAYQAHKLIVKHPDIRYWTMTVKKENVSDHIKAGPNKLYNYMIKLLLTDEMSRHSDVLFVPDPRSIKVESGNSLHDYIQAELWFEKNVSTQLTTKPMDSCNCTNLQFADMLSGMVQHHFENGESEAYQYLKGKITVRKLYHR